MKGVIFFLGGGGPVPKDLWQRFLMSIFCKTITLVNWFHKEYIFFFKLNIKRNKTDLYNKEMFCLGTKGKLACLIFSFKVLTYIRIYLLHVYIGTIFGVYFLTPSQKWKKKCNGGGCGVACVCVRGGVCYPAMPFSIASMVSYSCSYMYHWFYVEKGVVT